MNTPASSPPAPNEVPVAAAPSRSPFIQNILKFISWIGIALGVLLGLLDYVDILPESWKTNTGVVIAIASGGVILAFLQAFEKLGDLLDDGKPNGSFKLAKKINLITGKTQMLLVLILCAVLALSSCVTSTMSDGKLAAAKAGLRVAEVAFAGAASLLMGYVAEGRPAWQQAMASKGLEAAAKQLRDAEAALEREQARRDALLLLPASAKTVIDVTASK